MTLHRKLKRTMLRLGIAATVVASFSGQSCGTGTGDTRLERHQQAAVASAPGVRLAVQTPPTPPSGAGPRDASSQAAIREISVGTTGELRSALESATPGTIISLRPGTYDSGNHRRGLSGTAAAPIVIQSQDPASPAVISGPGDGFGLADAAYVTFRDLVFDAPQENGINVDDAETVDTPAHHITFTRVAVRNLRDGNRDGIKLSGVTDFVIEDSTIDRWGSDGSAIDMVGCHRGVIRNNVFRHIPGITVGNGVQVKGGSTDITITGNRFEHAAARGVQIGGTTGLQFFRPQPPGNTEARDIVVERNVFVGGETAVAFVSSDGGTFRFNTIYQPTRYLLRILSEQTAPGFLPTSNGSFTDNVVYWTADQGVNIGPGTQPQTFTFARNWWYRADAPGDSRPALPGTEEGGVYGADPAFLAAPANLRTQGGLRQGAYAR